MVGYLNLVLRLIIWLLLTANLSTTNIVMGVIIAFILPHNHQQIGAFKDWLRIVGQVLLAIPRAYLEALELILRPHLQEDITSERVKPRRTSGLIFLDIFLITFTPKTIVLNYQEDGWYEVHRVTHRRRL
ncbi:MAG TPA: Na+/H+ antiporter subunit E [Leptolyngbyaceae cyanobacterium]